MNLIKLNDKLDVSLLRFIHSFSLFFSQFHSVIQAISIPFDSKKESFHLTVNSLRSLELSAARQLKVKRFRSLYHSVQTSCIL